MTAPYKKPSDADGCIVALALTLLVPINYALRGVVIATCWRWFAMPTFPSLPAITAPAAVGLILTYSAWRGWTPVDAKMENAEGVELVVEVLKRDFVFPALLLLVAWVLHTWWPLAGGAR